MNKYEMVLILDGHLNTTEKDEIIKQAVEILNKSEGKVINSNVWMEKHRMSFPIKKVWDGSYYLVNFDAQSSSIAKIRQLLQLNEKVLRYLIVRQVEKKPTPPPKAKAEAKKV